jgi:hypothetical protein
VSCGGDDDSADFANVFHGVFEKNEAHVGEVIVVFLEGVIQVLFKLFVGHLVVNSFSSDAVNEVTENKILLVLLLEVSREVVLSKRFLNQIKHYAFVKNDVFVSHQSVAISSFRFVNPNSNHLLRVLELSG